MKDKWLEKYKEAVRETSFSSTVLTGFNVNIDRTIRFQELDRNPENVEAEKLETVSSNEDLTKVLKYCRENSCNLEASLNNFKPDLPGSKQLGGQGGIITNFMSRLGNRSVFYTPFLSPEIVDLIDSDVVYPVFDETLGLRNIGDCVNSDRTKTNYIIEFEDESCRLILSDRLRGFGPFFRQSIAKNLYKAEESIDRVILSGFHDADGNFEAKLDKSRQQLANIKIPKHLEFVSKSERQDRKLLNHVAPCFDSIGVDSRELGNIAELLGLEINEEPSIEEAFEAGKKIIEDVGVLRVHLHTLNFHTVIAKNSYPFEMSEIRRSMLFGSLAAVSMAEKGGIPGKDEIEFVGETMHVNRLDALEEFGESFGESKFAEKGMAQVEDYKVVAIPTVIHEKPERIVGMGDIISSGAFIAEIN